jgi:hypothetical protein
MRFRTKVDALLVVPMAVGLGLPVLLIVRVLAEGRPLMGAAFPLALLIAILPLGLVSYAVTDRELIVRQGWLRWRMPLERVQVLKATRAIWSSPALSLDRIEIRTDRGVWLLVSPSDRAGFVAAVRARAPHVRLEGFVSSASQAVE